MEQNEHIFGIHSVIEAIESGRTIDKLFMKKDLNGELATRLCHLAKDHGIAIQRVPVERLNRITRKNHQGVVALISAIDYCSLHQLVPTL
ncbi:MAG: 23S rRNA (guanosine(2251)-2'-O)-methyltransferase RlmB, partial [Muribaculaceae bacterium]|nr:23S rRNA (guanosine(2251)-2'-O)-methyltransferase RlmB [Muribaculaceae bacterium]